MINLLIGSESLMIEAELIGLSHTQGWLALVEIDLSMAKSFRF
jgi:hypothetical protein